MTINQMRTYISQHPKYKNSQSWVDKCLRMSDNQVLAIYDKFRKLDYNELDKQYNKEEDDE